MCLGDGGSPLCCLLSDGVTYALVGVASWSTPCGDGLPALFTAASFYLDFILGMPIILYSLIIITLNYYYLKIIFLNYYHVIIILLNYYDLIITLLNYYDLLMFSLVNYYDLIMFLLFTNSVNFMVKWP